MISVEISSFTFKRFASPRCLAMSSASPPSEKTVSLASHRKVHKILMTNALKMKLRDSKSLKPDQTVTYK